MTISRGSERTSRLRSRVCLQSDELSLLRKAFLARTRSRLTLASRSSSGAGQNSAESGRFRVEQAPSTQSSGAIKHAVPRTASSTRGCVRSDDFLGDLEEGPSLHHVATSPFLSLMDFQTFARAEAHGTGP